MTADEAKRGERSMSSEMVSVRKCGSTHAGACLGNRILYNSGGVDIDEVVLSDVEMVHIEQMDGRCWWIGVYFPDGSRWSGNFSCDSRGRMIFTQQDEPDEPIFCEVREREPRGGVV